MVSATSMLVAGILSVSAPPSEPPQEPVRVYAFTVQADANGLVAPDLKERMDSLVDLKSQLFLGRNPVLRVTPKPEDAQVVVEVLSRTADPKDRDIRTVRVKVSSGPHSQVFEGRDDDGSWTRAAGDAAKQIRKWIALNYALFTAPKKTP